MNTEKYKNLDGLRGLAAVVVVLLHFVTAFAPFLIGFSNFGPRHTAADRLISTTPLGLPFAGNLSVCVFFVLSGFVLSLGYFKSRSRRKLLLSASRRYFRLMLPVLASVMLCYAALRTGMIHAHPASQLSGSHWLESFWNFPAQFGDALWQALYGVFFLHSTDYNVVLWTMQLELFGSFMVFAFLGLFGTFSRRWLVYLALGLLFSHTYYLAFFIGMAFCDLTVNKPAPRLVLSNKLLVLLLPLAALLGTWDIETSFHNVYDSLSVPLFNAAETETLAHIIAAAIIVLAVLRLPRLIRFFESRFLQFLGKISFSLYLTHFVILGSFSSFMFQTLLPKVGYEWTMVTVFGLTMPLMVGAAVIFNRYVDALAIVASRRIIDYPLSAYRRTVALLAAAEDTVVADELAPAEQPVAVVADPVALRRPFSIGADEFLARNG